MHHRFTCTKNALAIRVTRRIGQITDHVLLDFLGRIKAKYGQITDVEFDDFLTVLFHLTGAVHDGPAYVVTDVGQLVGFLNGSQSPSEGSFVG